VHKVELADTIAVAAAFTDAAGRWFANASTVKLDWRVHPTHMTLSPQAARLLLMAPPLWAAAASLVVPSPVGKHSTVRVLVEALPARGLLLTANLTLQLVPPLALRPPAVAVWAGTSPEGVEAAGYEAVYLLGGTTAAALSTRFEGHLAALLTSSALHAGAPNVDAGNASSACVPPNATAHVLFTIARRPPTHVISSEEQDDADSDGDADAGANARPQKP
jgi:hypothetical protein